MGPNPPSEVKSGKAFLDSCWKKSLVPSLASGESSEDNEASLQ